MRNIKPDNITINQWVLPFLKSKDIFLRLSALRIIIDSIDMYPQFISTLLLHLRYENSSFIIRFINKKMRNIKPDNITINQWVLPFLKSKDIFLRLSALRIIIDSIDMYPQFISTLLLHLRYENSSFIIRFINKKISYITPLDKKTFYQGKEIVDNIESLNVHFNRLNQWFIQLGLLHPNDINRWINTVLKKSTANRNKEEQETFALYQETKKLTEDLENSLLNTPSKTYSDFLQFLKNYTKYSGHPVYINKDTNNLIQFFYLNFHTIG